MFEVQLHHEEGVNVAEVAASVRRILDRAARRRGFTIETQRQILETLGSVLNVLTFAVGALGSISLLVGGVGIFTIMTIGVRERTAEIGLLRALGAARIRCCACSSSEAVLLSALGGVAGLAVGVSFAAALDLGVPALPVSYSPLFIALAEALAIAVGLLVRDSACHACGGAGAGGGVTRGMTRQARGSGAWGSGKT